MKENKLLIIIIFLLFHLNHSYNFSYLTFNLRSYINNSINYDNGTSFIYSNLNSLYYTEIIFGSSEKEYIMQVNLDDYDFKLTNYNCDIQTKDKSTNNIFDPFLSDSSNVEISGNDFLYYGENQVYRITDYIKILSNKTNNNYIYPRIIFIYNPRNLTFSKKSKDFSPYTCFKLGLRLPFENYDLYEDYEISLLGRFKRNNIINSYEWFIEYESESEKKDAKLIIGTSPHEYNNKKYNVNKSKIINGFYSIFNYNYWNFEFTQIYMKNKNNKREFLERRHACLVPSLNVIKGTYEYQKIINDTIFSELINNHKCYEDFDLENDIFYCDNEIEVKKYIKDRFLNLIFFNALFEEEFILTYDDLFIEKGNKIFFLVVFDYSNSLITWIIGKPFLKKYFFSYNYNMRTMRYYKINNKIKEEENIENNNNQWILIIISLVLIIIFCIFGFLLEKYYYEHKRKKNATELDDDNFRYEGNHTINNSEGLIHNN